MGHAGQWQKCRGGGGTRERRLTLKAAGCARGRRAASVTTIPCVRILSSPFRVFVRSLCSLSLSLSLSRPRAAARPCAGRKKGKKLENLMPPPSLPLHATCLTRSRVRVASVDRDAKRDLYVGCVSRSSPSPGYFWPPTQPRTYYYLCKPVLCSMVQKMSPNMYSSLASQGRKKSVTLSHHLRQRLLSDVCTLHFIIFVPMVS